MVVADRLAPGLLLDELRPEVELVDAAKIPYGPAARRRRSTGSWSTGPGPALFVVRLKGGDPYVFGRGGEEVLACAEAGVPVTVVPGVTSAIAVPAAAGIPVTHRGVAHEFTVVSGHLAPDDPESLVDWAALARLRGTLVILMGLKNLPAIAATLLAHGRDAGDPGRDRPGGHDRTPAVGPRHARRPARPGATACARPPSSSSARRDDCRLLSRLVETRQAIDTPRVAVAQRGAREPEPG